MGIEVAEHNAVSAPSPFTNTHLLFVQGFTVCHCLVSHIVQFSVRRASRSQFDTGRNKYKEKGAEKGEETV